MMATNDNRAREALRAIAADLRTAAMEHGPDLDAADRRGLYALATMIERHAKAAAMGRHAIAQAVDSLIGVHDALDAPHEDMEPGLGAPENHPTAWGFGVKGGVAVDQTDWARGTNDDREVEDENDEEGDTGIGDPEGAREQALRHRAIERRAERDFHARNHAVLFHAE